MEADKTQARSRVIWSIQYLRAAAAIVVVFYHQLQSFGGIFLLGAHGVDVFFVISGFIMVVKTDDRNVTPANFALDRVVRIVPPYWLATAIAYGLSLRGSQNMFHPSKDLALLAKSLLFIPAMNAFGYIQPTLYLGWTLAYEMFFYAIFSVVLFAQKGRMLILLVVLIGLVCLGDLFQPTGAVGFTYTGPLLLEFLAGALVGKLFGTGLCRCNPTTQFFGSGFLAASLFTASLRFPTLVFGGFAILIVTGGLLLERHNRVPKVFWLRSLGDASFAIYLFQEFSFMVVRIVKNHFFPVAISSDPSLILIKGACIVTAIGVGILIWRYFEVPATRRFRKALRRATGNPVRISIPEPTV